MKKNSITIGLVVGSVVFLSGCASLHKTDNLEAEVAYLRNRLEEMTKEKDKEIQRLQAEKDRQVRQMEDAQSALERALKKEIGEYQAKLEMTERGLVITFLTEIFFNSGKAEVRDEGKEALSKVAEVLNANVPDSAVAVEGHTDNVPIKYSGWKSNWELSSARALAVLHFLIDESSVAPTRLSANGYGEFRPVTANDTPEGRQQNRRVEIVILPSELKKVKAEE